jgi:signal transduction histidine kinase
MRTRRQLTDELTARAEAAERAQVVEAERAVADERARIARELHDVIAHTVSVMVVQAGAARRMLQRDPARAADAIGRIEATGRDALTELRHMLSLLRDDGDAALEPQPRIGQLDELVTTMEDAGVPISLAVDGPLDDLPAGVALSAYRIVQEALTNVLKHAGPTRAVAVEVSRRDDELAIAVRDDGQGAASGDGQGRGLIGLHERVALLHGSFHARPRRGGGFEVVATLPVEPAVRADGVSGGPA